MRAERLMRYRRSSRRRWSTRPAAATPIARDCCSASRSDWDWERTGRLASVMGSLKIASRGAQNHAVNREIVAALYAKAFGERVLGSQRWPFCPQISARRRLCARVVGRARRMCAALRSRSLLPLRGATRPIGRIRRRRRRSTGGRSTDPPRVPAPPAARRSAAGPAVGSEAGAETRRRSPAASSSAASSATPSSATQYAGPASS